jgi:hypothetical protein
MHGRQVAFAILLIHIPMTLRLVNLVYDVAFV